MTIFRPGKIARSEEDKSILPELPYLETHLTDHCNLKCKGCGHLCPISPERYTDLEVFTKDVYRLAELFRNIRSFRLMGGEPLLHPSVTEFCIAARHVFPSVETDIRLVTNGILLPSMKEKFWEVCADNRVSIDLSLYPINIDFDKIFKSAEGYKVTLQIRKRTEFIKFPRNLSGDTDPEKAFHVCRSLYNTPFLENGKIYPCCLPALSHLLQSRFGVEFSICSGDYLNIHDNDLTGADIIGFITNPVPFCRYCASSTPTSFNWGISKGKAEEWLD